MVVADVLRRFELKTELQHCFGSLSLRPMSRRLWGSAVDRFGSGLRQGFTKVEA